MSTKKDKSNKMIGYAMYAVAVGLPFTNIPQISQLYSTKVTTGLSVTTWIMYFVFGLIPLLYAVANKLRPLIISNVLWLGVDLLMIYGIIRYSPRLMPSGFDHLLMINNIGKGIGYVSMFLISLACALFAADLVAMKQVRAHGKK